MSPGSGLERARRRSAARIAWMQAISRMSAWVVIGLGLIAISGWVVVFEGFNHPLPRPFSMHALAAFGLALAGASLRLGCSSHARGSAPRLALILAAAVLLIGLMRAIEHGLALGAPFRI